MKKLIALIFITLGLAVSPIGCSSVTRTAYTETVKTPKTVEQALKEWNTYIETHTRHVTLAMNNNVRDAFNKWKQYTLNVIDLGKQMSSTNSVVNKPDLEAALHTQITGASQASTDLINLIKLYSK